MIISISTVLYIILIHFLADFALQTHDQASKKSTSNVWLTYHVSTYSFVWLIAAYMLFESIKLSISFAIITFLTHYLVDYFTSRIGKPFWEKNDYHNGFVVVGADQVVHYICLFATYLALRQFI